MEDAGVSLSTERRLPSKNPMKQVSQDKSDLPLTSEEALQKAQAEGLTLRKTDNNSGFANVYVISHLGRLPVRPYQAKMYHNGKTWTLGSFATAEEAALCVARSPMGQEAAERAVAAALPSLTREEVLQQAQAEGLVLRVSDYKTGYFGVSYLPGRTKPFQAKVRRSGKDVYLSSFATAEEAALCVARSPEGQAMAKRARVAPPSESANSAPAAALTAAATAAAVALAASARATAALQQARDAAIGTIALDVIYEAAGAAANELSAEVAEEVMAGIAMGL